MLKMKPKTHFGKRCTEYGITSVNGDKLGIKIHHHVIGKKKSDAVERVGVYKTSLFYRFIVDEGVFFCPISKTGWPYTVYTRDMFRKQRKAKKHRRRAMSRKNYRGART